MARDGGHIRHPLSYIAEAADDICYRIVDIEDARELKVLSFKDMLEVTEPLHNAIKIDLSKFDSLDSDRRRSSMLRTMMIGELVKSAQESFVNYYDEILEETQSNR